MIAIFRIFFEILQMMCYLSNDVFNFLLQFCDVILLLLLDF